MPASETPRVAAIQALRGLAALTVAAVHFVSGFLHYIDGRTFLPVGLSEQTASAAVALFFMISGCVMVLSARMLFGSWRINERKDWTAPRLSLQFDEGELNLYACSVRFIDVTGLGSS